MRRFLQLIYSYFLLPMLFLTVSGLSIFSAKYRRAFLQRFQVMGTLKRFLSETADTSATKRIMFHCASMGEFEHIKPLITKFAEANEVNIVVTFFSPSGYENVKSFPGVNLFLYLPFDFKSEWRRFYNLLKPRFIVISKHDTWPNQIWQAHKAEIPIFLVNASLGSESSRLKGLAKIFFRQLYKYFTEIYAIGEEDKKRFESNFNEVRVFNIGDTKFDQVLIRKEWAKHKNLIDRNWLGQNLILLLGSVWAEDLVNLKEAVKKLYQNKANLKLVIVPHQPQEQMIRELVEFFGRANTRLFSNPQFEPSSRILIVDIVGILADLYKYAHIAYVGGSFKQGIHNVMEPAIYGIPVVYGPQYENSYDAVRLKEKGGSIVIHSAAESYTAFDDLVRLESYRESLGHKAKDFALSNTGATRILFERWQKYLQ